PPQPSLPTKVGALDAWGLPDGKARAPGEDAVCQPDEAADRSGAPCHEPDGQCRPAPDVLFLQRHVLLRHIIGRGHWFPAAVLGPGSAARWRLGAVVRQMLAHRSLWSAFICDVEE